MLNVKQCQYVFKQIQLFFYLFHHFFLKEKTKFAKKCRKRGGFFKCCVQLLYMNIFERTRNNLIQDGLIKDKPTSFCRPIGDLGLDNCHICTTDAMCTEMDTATGKVTHTFFKGSKKHQNVRLTESIIYIWRMEFVNIFRRLVHRDLQLLFWSFMNIVVDWRSAVGISPSLWTQICLVSNW